MANNRARRSTDAIRLGKYLLYAAAVTWSAVSTFGSAGMLLAVMVCAAWLGVFASVSRPRALQFAGFVLLVSGCLYGLLAPAFYAVREGTRNRQCPNNLKQIALSLHEYHDVFHTFPPAFIADKDGRPMHSWRVLILPFLDQPLYEAYRFDEPWNGPNNRQLLTRMPPCYACSSHQPREQENYPYTSYVAIVGPDTAWPGVAATRIVDIRDGTAQTLLVCEVADRQIPWMEPTDVEYADGINLLSLPQSIPFSGHIQRSFFYEWSHGRSVAFADGSVGVVVEGIDQNDARRLLSTNDSEPFDIHAVRGAPTHTRRLRIDNCVRLGVFVLLALWPLPWVWIHPHGPGAAADSGMKKSADKA